jgi:hypothetical protein
MMSMLCNCCVRELLILARTWFAFGLPSKTGCDILEDQLINTQQQLAEANEHLDMHHQEIEDMEANEDVDIEGGEEPASSLDTASSGRPPSPESSVASFAH